MTTANTTKPTFAISIHDGYCEWTYMLPISEKLCIDAIATQICKVFDIEMPEPIERVELGNLAESLLHVSSHH